jgi:hypothetical protein
MNTRGPHNGDRALLVTATVVIMGLAGFVAAVIGELLFAIVYLALIPIVIYLGGTRQ